MTASPIGVLVMAYGGPNTLDEVEPYLRDVRGFRPTPPAVVEEIKGRYAAIGGRSPIRERTEAQARALEEALNANGDGRRFAAAVGMRHWQPRIADALTALERAGHRRVVGLVMAPHYSRLSVDLYFEAVERARGAIEIAPLREWHLLPGYLGVLARRIRTALERFPPAARGGAAVLFTAHSLPRRILEWRDPYPDQLAATVAAVMERVGPRPHRFAFQSAGRTPEPWLGPDAAAVLEELAAAGHRHVLVAPIGFTCEHVEVLYDVDIELRRAAAERGVQLERIAMVDDDPVMMADLAGLVRSAARERGWL